MFTFLLFIGEKENKNNEVNDQITITIVDYNNNEELVGVNEKNSNSYSNFNGEIKLQKNTNVHLSLISYEDILISDIKNDTIIKLKR